MPLPAYLVPGNEGPGIRDIGAAGGEAKREPPGKIGTCWSKQAEPTEKNNK